MKAPFEEGGKSIQVDFRGDPMGRFELTMRMDGGRHVIVLAHDTAYLRGDEKFWAAAGVPSPGQDVYVAPPENKIATS